MLQPLEPRRLFSVTTSLSAGVLTVTSDGASDHVRITTHHGDYFVYSGHHLVAAIHDLNSIVVNLNGGDDSLDTDSSVHAPMQISGGHGNDVLRAGSGHDLISGNDGDDLIYADDGVADNVDGGAGTDSAFVDHHDTVHNVEHIHHHGHHHHDAKFRDDLIADVLA